MILSNSLTSPLKVYNCILRGIRQNHAGNKALPLLPALTVARPTVMLTVQSHGHTAECTQQHSTSQLITTCSLPAQEQLFTPSVQRHVGKSQRDALISTPKETVLPSTASDAWRFCLEALFCDALYQREHQLNPL